MTKNDPRKALGKGLHSLLPSRNTAAAPAPATTPAAPVAEPTSAEHAPQTLPIEQVAPNPNQPRREFDPAALMELTQSIERDGIIQPIIVRKIAAKDYQIIAGERRWRAAKAAGLKDVPVVVREADDQQVLELAIIENIQREDLNPIELAVAFHRMGTELGLSHEQIGQKTGKERTTVTNAVRLLQLPEELQHLVAAKELSAGHARALLKFDDREMQRDIALRCISEGWSVRQIEQFTKPKPPSGGVPKAPTTEYEPQDPNVKFAVSELERMLGTRVRIIANNKGKGRIEIEYYSVDDLTRIYEAMTEPRA